MDGSSRIGRATVSEGTRRARPALIGPPWRIVGSRDFNDDGETDLLWHNSTTNETQIWHMNKDKRGSRATVESEDGKAILVGLPWSIVGANDFNGDGATDILWHNKDSGETQIWHMKEHQISDRATVVAPTGKPMLVGLPWRIVGTNDFNADGKSDILWHNGTTNETQIWHMDDRLLGGRATVVAEDNKAIFVGLPWSIVGTNDFDRDKAADILWHNKDSGETQIWLMNGHSIARRATVDADRDGGGALVGPPWSIMNH